MWVNAFRTQCVKAKVTLVFKKRHWAERFSDRWCETDRTRRCVYVSLFLFQIPSLLLTENPTSRSKPFYGTPAVGWAHVVVVRLIPMECVDRCYKVHLKCAVSPFGWKRSLNAFMQMHKFSINKRISQRTARWACGRWIATGAAHINK